MFFSVSADLTFIELGKTNENVFLLFSFYKTTTKKKEKYEIKLICIFVE